MKSYKLYTLKEQFIEESDNVPLHFTGMAEFVNGVRMWYKDGKWHREDGPFYYDKDMKNVEWGINNMLHRIGGPACISPYEEPRYYVYGEYVSKEYHDILFNIMKLKGLL